MNSFLSLFSFFFSFSFTRICVVWHTLSASLLSTCFCLSVGRSLSLLASLSIVPLLPYPFISVFLYSILSAFFHTLFTLFPSSHFLSLSLTRAQHPPHTLSLPFSCHLPLSHLPPSFLPDHSNGPKASYRSLSSAHTLTLPLQAKLVPSKSNSRRKRSRLLQAVLLRATRPMPQPQHLQCRPCLPERTAAAAWSRVLPFHST